MTDRDIVERLRSWGGRKPNTPEGECHEAADEIERLRSVATAEMKLREGNFETICDLLDEAKRLRAEVLEQCRLNGIGGSREAKLIAERDQLRARVAELEAALENAQRHIDFFDPVTKCARCGIENRQTGMVPDEGDEWECFECWERLNAKERAERAAAMKSGG